MHQNDHPVLHRRAFLKGSMYLGTSLSLLSLTGCQSTTPKDKSKNDVQPQVKKSFHVCPRNCFDQCSLVADQVDGQIVRIAGDMTNPYTAGTPCVKGHTHINVLYHPDRLLYPLKRAGKKGEGKWVRISWEEAYSILTEKLKECISKYGPESITPYNFSGTVGFLSQLGIPWRFFNKLECTKITRTVCNTGGMEALQYTYGDFSSLDPEDYIYTKCYVAWGVNESHSNVHAVKFINKARDKGAKLIVISPYRNPFASQADLFIQPTPGTDAALALGIQHVIINQGLYDKQFVENYTLGFEELKTKVQEFSPSKVAKICGITEEEIYAFVKMYTTNTPGVVRMGFGMQRRVNGGSAIRAISFLPALMGDVGKKGGGFSYVNYLQKPFSFPYLQQSKLLTNPNPRTFNVNQIGKALTGQLETTKQNPIKFLFCFNGNPIPSAPNVNLIKEGLKREDLFTVVYDVFMTDTADYADLVLPASHFFEYEDIYADYLALYVRYSEKALEPIGESKPNVVFFNELAKRMGYTEECFDETFESIMANGVLNKPEFKDVKYAILKEKKWIKIDVGGVWSDHIFKTPSKKIEFYSEKAKAKGLPPVADYVPDQESSDGSPDLYKKYPIHLISPTAAQLLNGQWHNVPYIAESLGEPTITINEKDALSRGIKQGDYVYAFNSRGRVKLKAKVSKGCTKPGVAMSYKSFWEKVIKGNTINSLALDAVGDMGGISTFYTNLIQIEKA